MSGNVYAVTEIVGSSTTSMEDAMQTAIETANKTIQNLDWFEVLETRGHIDKGRIGHYQVVMKVGFRYGDEASV